MLALAFGFRRDEELLCRNFARALRPEDDEPRVVSDQRRRETRRADEVSRPGVAEDRVIAVVACRHQRFAAAVFGKQAVACTVIPAAWALKKIAADRSHGANLRAADSFAGLHQRAIARGLRVIDQLLHG